MVKSKKMSKTSIAVIVLAILLVLSLCLGLTGAWFTDSAAGGTATTSFGTIQLTSGTYSNAVTRANGNAASADNGGTNLMPGDTVTFSGTIANNGDKAYLIVVLSTYIVDGSGNPVATTTLTENNQGALDDITITIGSYDLSQDVVGGGNIGSGITAKQWCALVVPANMAATNVSIARGIGEDLTNELQGYGITFTVEFYAVQYANFDTNDLEDVASAATTAGVVGWARNVTTVWTGPAEDPQQP